MSGARAETIVVALASGSALHLRADLNAICDFESEIARVGLDPVREFARLESGDRPTMSAVRAMVWACARDKRPDLTVKGVGALMQTDGAALVAGMRDALNRAAPDAAQAGDGDDAGKTPPPQP